MVLAVLPQTTEMRLLENEYQFLKKKKCRMSQNYKMRRSTRSVRQRRILRKLNFSNINRFWRRLRLQLQI